MHLCKVWPAGFSVCNVCCATETWLICTAIHHNVHSSNWMNLLFDWVLIQEKNSWWSPSHKHWFSCQKQKRRKRRREMGTTACASRCFLLYLRIPGIHPKLNNIRWCFTALWQAAKLFPLSWQDESSPYILVHFPILHILHDRRMRNAGASDHREHTEKTTNRPIYLKHTMENITKIILYTISAIISLSPQSYTLNL